MMWGGSGNRPAPGLSPLCSTLPDATVLQFQVLSQVNHEREASYAPFTAIVRKASDQSDAVFLAR